MVLGVAGNKVSHIYSTLHQGCNYGSDISQLRVLASHNTSLGSVAQGALELESWEIRKCHFLSDACVFGYIFYEKVPIETFYISSQSTHNKQQAGNKSICTEEREGDGYDSYKYVFKFRW